MIGAGLAARLPRPALRHAAGASLSSTATAARRRSVRQSKGMLYARLSPHATALSELAAAGLDYTARLLRPPGSSVARTSIRRGAAARTRRTSGLRQSRLGGLGWPASFSPASTGRTRLRPRRNRGPVGRTAFPRAGWVRPPRSAALSPRILRFGSRSAARPFICDGRETAGRFRGRHRPDRERAVVVDSRFGCVDRFAETAHLPLRLIRGQLTFVRATPASRACGWSLCGDGISRRPSAACTAWARPTSSGTLDRRDRRRARGESRQARPLAPHSTPRSTAIAARGAARGARGATVFEPRLSADHRPRGRGGGFAAAYARLSQTPRWRSIRPRRGSRGFT